MNCFFPQVFRLSNDWQSTNGLSTPTRCRNATHTPDSACYCSTTAQSLPHYSHCMSTRICIRLHLATLIHLTLFNTIFYFIYSPLIAYYLLYIACNYSSLWPWSPPHIIILRLLYKCWCDLKRHAFHSLSCTWLIIMKVIKKWHDLIWTSVISEFNHEKNSKRLPKTTQSVDKYLQNKHQNPPQ